MVHDFARVRAEDVTDLDSLQRFIMQQLGVGYVTKNDAVIYRKKMNELFEHYPQANIGTMLKVVEWAKTRRRRFSRLFQVVEAVRYAYEDGYLPELDPGNRPDLDERINEILREEEDPEWRRRLLTAQGETAKTALLDQWQQLRGG